MTDGHEMQETIARALCENSTQPCNEHFADAGIAVTALVLAGYLKTDDGAGASPAATSAAPLAPAAQAGETIGSPAPSSPRLFELLRKRDVSGVTGTGSVADGVVWTDSTVTLRWKGDHPATAVWDSVESILAVHGHEGATVVRWLDGEPA